MLIAALVFIIGFALRKAGLSAAANIAQIASLASLVAGLAGWALHRRAPDADRPNILGELLQTIADGKGLTGEDLRAQIRGYDGDAVDAYLDGTQKPSWDFVIAFLDVVADKDKYRREVLERRIRPVWRMSTQPLPTDGRTEEASADPELTGEPVNVLLGDVDHQTANGNHHRKDGALKDEPESPDRSDEFLATIPALPSAQERETLPVDDTNDTSGDENGRLKEWLNKIPKVWLIIGVSCVAVAIPVTLVLIQIIGESDASINPNPAASSAVSTAPAATSGWPNERWIGELLLSENGSVTLSSVPPNVNSDSAEADIILLAGTLEGANPVASWTGTGPPTAGGCSKLMRTEGVRDIIPKPGLAICVKTTQGDIGILVIKKNYVDQNGSVTSTLVQATIWSNRISAPYEVGLWANERWTGELLLSENGSVSLSSVPPNVNSDSAEADIILLAGTLEGANPVASWTGTGPPTAGACANLIPTEGVKDIAPKPGLAICVKTIQGDIGVLVVKKNYVDQSGSVTSTLVQATIWSR